MRLHKLPNGYVLTSDEITREEANVTPHYQSVDGRFFKVIDHDFSSLSPEEQKEIGWFDAEKLFNSTFPNNHLLNSHDYNNLKDGFIEGFQKAQELLGGFTLEDMENAFYNGWIYRGEGHDFPRAKKEYLQQLSQTKSWEVEVEMETLYLEEDSMNYTHEQDDVSGSKEFPKLTNGKVKILRIL